MLLPCRHMYDLVYEIISQIVLFENKNPKLKRLKLMSGDGLYGYNMQHSSFEGLILHQPWFEKEENGQDKEFTKKAKKKFSSSHIYWDTATSYDATKAFLKAITMSENPNRKTVLKNLASVRLKPSETSGDDLDLKAERKQKTVIVEVVGGKRCPQGEKLCFELVSH